MDNKDYFKFSQTNDDDIVDFSKPEGVLVVNRNADEPETVLMVANHKLIELITTYKTLKADDYWDCFKYVFRCKGCGTHIGFMRKTYFVKHYNEVGQDNKRRFTCSSCGSDWERIK